jgi:protein-S-isoprenylcysteine O-methyltransferase Ste14
MLIFQRYYAVLIIVIAITITVTTTTTAFTSSPAVAITITRRPRYNLLTLHHGVPLCNTNLVVRKATEDNSNKDDDDNDDDAISVLKKKIDLSNLNLDQILENLDQIRSNVFEGKVGQRGEVYVIIQAILFLGLGLGFLPVVEDTIELIFGPISLIIGLIVSILSTLGLGKSLSPWPVPVDENKGGDGLVITGLYSQVRHPLYSGVLLIGVGLAVITNSVPRFLFTLFLLYLFEIKSNYEENALQDAFPTYDEYMEEVPTKFIPKSLLEILNTK